VVREKGMSVSILGRKNNLPTMVEGELSERGFRLRVRFFGWAGPILLDIAPANLSRVTVNRAYGVVALSLYADKSEPLAVLDSSNPGQWIDEFRRLGVRIDGKIPAFKLNKSFHIVFWAIQIGTIAMLAAIALAAFLKLVL